ncbi:hypothetical protein COCNU_scaffold002010G000020 [Cocos nucifera]|nr:hypothetical protein [Cocos nucifera]
MNHMRSEVVKIQKDHQAKTNCLLKEKVEVDRLLGKKMVEVRSLQEMIQNAKHALAKAKEELNLEIKKRGRAKAKVTEVEQVLRQLQEVKTKVVEEFKASLEMKDIKIEFARLSFIKDMNSAKRM